MEADRRASGSAARVSDVGSLARELFIGYIKIHVLHHAAEAPIYGAAFLDELARHGYQLSPGTLYPLLHRLETSGYLRRENRLVNGKIRKYYAATEIGRAALANARAKLRELVDEVAPTDLG